MNALVTAAEMRALEARAVECGTSEDELMEGAGAGLARVVRQFWPQPGYAMVFAGKGHNGGDAFVLARHLVDDGWKVEVRAFPSEDSWRPLTREKWQAVRAHGVPVPPWAIGMTPARRPLLLVDGLLGTGAGGALKEEVREVCRAMNDMRTICRGETLAIDLPTGLDADSGEPDKDAVVADVTATLGHPKRGLCAPGAEDYTGRLAVVPLDRLPPPENWEERDGLITPWSFEVWLRCRRPFSMHKGQARRVGILAGSRGLTGAARLAATAAVAAGGGMVTLFCPRDVYEILAASCPPEVMVRPVNSCMEVMEFPLDAIGVGPGLGDTPPPYLASLLRDDPRPVIVDASALSLMAAHGISLHGRRGGMRLLTPHPGELAKLAQAFVPGADDAAKALAAEHRATVLRKGSRSAVIEPGLPVAYNTTGHPMMAKGGMGDVLTGFCATFAAQGMRFYDAACLGSWLLGFSAEQARLAGGDAPESFTPTRLIEMTGASFAALRRGGVY